MAKQSIVRHSYASAWEHFVAFAVHDAEHRVSWENWSSEDGTATIELFAALPTHPKAAGGRPLSVTISEHGARSSREATITLTEEMARALFDALREAYGSD